MQPSIPIYASVKKPKSRRGNIGDTFSFALLKHLGHKIIRYGIDQRESMPQGTYALVGSILEQLPEQKNMNIFGPGFISAESSGENLKGNNLFGVRGYFSQEKLKKSSGINVDVVSDPGLLYSEINVGTKNPKKEIGFIIHSADRETFFNSFPHLSDNLIDNYSTITKFHESLTNYSTVFSSSLHGVIFCHSIGKHVVPLKVGDNLIGDDFKFRDYFSSIDLDVSREDISIDPLFLNHLIENYREFPQPNSNKLHDMKRNLSIQLEEIVSGI